MTSRKRLVALVGAAALATSGLVAAGTAPAANAATPVCSGLVTGLDATDRAVYRTWENADITEEKKAVSPLSVSPHAFVFSGGRSLSGGGSVASYTAFSYGNAPVVYDIVNKTSSSTLAVKYVKKLSKWFKGRLIVTGGSYYLYAVDGYGTLRQWTRYADDAGHVWFDSPKIVAKYLSGLKALSYAWTFKVDGVYKDFLYGTTSSGKLLQFQIPQKNPGAEKVTRLAASGFADFDHVSSAGCNNSLHYLSLVAIDNEGNQARLFTLPSQTVPKTYNLADRGLIGVGADWDLHSVG